MGQLRNLEVERVDAVDRPATGRTFTIIKSEDAASEDLRKAATDAVSALIKDEVQFSEETVEVLRRLAELLELDAEFKSVDGAPAEAEAEAEAETPAPNDFAAQIAEAVKAALPTALEELLEKEKAEDEESEVEASADEEAEEETAQVAKAKSKQPEGTGTKVVKKGEGLFENIIFGQ